MTDKLDKHRSELHGIAVEAAALSEASKKLLVRRTNAVARARKAGLSLREASIILDMTEHGLIKAAKPSQKRSSPPTTNDPTS